MPRFFSERLTKEELAKKIVEVGQTYYRDFKCNLSCDVMKDAKNIMCSCAYHLSEAMPQVFKDIGEIQFDFENVDCGFLDKDIPFCGFQTLPNGLTYMGIMAGGDWQIPVFFIVYWDGKDLRGYVPTDGNTFNHVTNRPYGNDPDSDWDAIKKTYANWIVEQYGEEDIQGFDQDPPDPHDFDFVDIDHNKMQADIQNRIQPKNCVPDSVSEVKIVVFGNPNKEEIKKLLQERSEELGIVGVEFLDDAKL